VSKRKHKKHAPNTTARLDTAMNTPAGEVNTELSRKRFWKDYNPIEKMTAMNIGFVALYSILTFCLCIIAYNQYRTARIDERPWIRIDVQTTPYNTPAFVIPVTVVNAGKTPATSFDAKFFVEVVKNGEEPLLSETSHELADSSTGVLFPNLPSTFPASYTLTKSEYEDFNDGRVFLVVYSKVSYRDFFRTEHWTRNCVFIGLPGHAYAAKKCTDYSGIDDN